MRFVLNHEELRRVCMARSVHEAAREDGISSLLDLLYDAMYEFTRRVLK
jgi:hypothetical protein